MRKILSCLFLGCFVTLAFADVPIVDYSTEVEQKQTKQFSTPATTEDSATSSVKDSFYSGRRLEQSRQQQDVQGLSREVEELQEMVQKLNGQVETQAHQIKQLDIQLKEFYQDLSQRLGVTPPSETTKAASKDLSVVPGPIVPLDSSSAKKSSSVKSQQVDSNSDKAFLKEQQMYQTAIDLLPDKKHESGNKLREYLRRYPKGVYVSNAHYWLGEINFLQKNFDAAEEEFKIVINKYPKSKRRANAILKLGLVYQNQGRTKRAKEELNRVIKSYPGTSAAQLARQQLAGS